MVGLLTEYNTNALCAEEIGEGLPYGACKSPIPSGVIAQHTEKTMQKPTTKAVLLLAAVALLSLSSFANDSDDDDNVYVKGYHRSDGTYVRPHYRSRSDGNISNNYGPPASLKQQLQPPQRDWDKDGIPNHLDSDSDNDGIPDERDPSPYER